MRVRRRGARRVVPPQQQSPCPLARLHRRRRANGSFNANGRFSPNGRFIDNGRWRADGRCIAASATIELLLAPAPFDRRPVAPST